MAAPIIELADDLVDKLKTATGYAFARRNAPYSAREDVVDGKWFVVVAGETSEVAGRGVDRSTLIVDVAYMHALPEATADQPDPVENRAWVDDKMALVENVKNEFRGGGSLRNESFLGFTFSKITNNPTYVLDVLLNDQLFLAVVRLEFIGEIEAD